MFVRKTIMHALAAGKIQPTRELFRILRQLPENRELGKGGLALPQEARLSRHIIMRAMGLSQDKE